MGIPGLSTFLSQYKKKYEERRFIRDTVVVIDGHNLMFRLHHSRGNNVHLGGGDNVQYAKDVREFFQDLKACGIVPLVIFDGACEEKKWETIYERFKQKLRANVKDKMPGNGYSPVTMSIVFREILVEQNILHYQTMLEADDTMAFVARRLKCPLLSSDSDFYIYPNVDNIPLDSIHFRKDRNKMVHQLRANVLALKKLCQEEFGFKDLRLLPLVAVIFGNDRIPSSTFTNLLNLKGGDNDKHCRFKNIFEWIGKHRDFEHVLKVILETLNQRKRIEWMDLIKEVLQNYEGQIGEVHVWNAIINDLRTLDPVLARQAEKTSGSIVMVDEGWDLPPSYAYSHTRCHFPTYWLQILRNRMVLLSPQVEIPQLPSTHALSVEVIRVTAGILLGDNEFTLLTREGKNVHQIRLKTTTLLPSVGQLLTISNPQFRKDGLKIFYDLFEVTPTETAFISIEVPSQLKFILLVLIYFTKKAQKKRIYGPMALALMLNYLQSFFRCQPFQVNLSEDQIEASTLKQLIENQSWSKELSAFFKQYDHSIRYSKSNPYEISYAYVFCQFNCLLHHGMRLNKLLDCPFRLPRLQILNPQFIYNVIASVNQNFSKNLDHFIDYHFPQNSSANLRGILRRISMFLHNPKKTTAELSSKEPVQFRQKKKKRSKAKPVTIKPQNDLFITNRFESLTLS